MRVSLVLELYEKQGQALTNTLEVESSDLEFFREILSVPEQDPLMYGSYKIEINLATIRFSKSMD